MKLNKGKFQTILILAIMLAAYLVLAFVIPFVKTAVFWLALVFTLAAFGLQLYVLKLSFEKGLDARSKFYGFPIARVASVYLIIQIVLSFLFMALAAFCPAWIAAVVFVLLLAAAAVGVVAADAMRDEVERQDRQLKTDVAAMRALQSRAAALTSRCEDAELKADAQKLSDADAKQMALDMDKNSYKVEKQTVSRYFDMQELKQKCEVETTYIDNGGATFVTAHAFDAE